MALRFILLLQLAVLVWELEVAAELALPGCASHCSNISIPYPFGTTPECYLNQDFFINCSSTHQAFLTDSNIDVLSISVSGQLRVLSYVARDCYNKSGQRVANNDPWMTLAKFPISHTRNKFMTVGCDTYAFIKGSSGKKYKTGCLSLCESKDSVINGSCSGIGCCQTTIPVNVTSIDISVDSYDSYTGVWEFNPCGFAFVAEDGYFNFSSADLLDLQNKTKVPTVLDWTIGDEKCDQAKENGTSYACKDNSYCYDPDNGPGYRCNCSEGYEGNPSLLNGCKGTIS